MYGVPELDGADPRLGHVADAADALGLYLSELAVAASDARAVGARRGGWRRIPADDVLGEGDDYSRHLLHFARAQLHLARTGDDAARAAVFDAPDAVTKTTPSEVVPRYLPRALGSERGAVRSARSPLRFHEISGGLWDSIFFSQIRSPVS